MEGADARTVSRELHALLEAPELIPAGLDAAAESRAQRARSVLAQAAHLLDGIDIDLDIGMFNDLVDIPPQEPLPAPHFHDIAVPRLGVEYTRGRVHYRGGYVYEPPGNVDEWRAVGDEPCVVFLTARGAIEYVDDPGPSPRSTTPSVTASYAAFVAGAGAAR